MKTLNGKAILDRSAENINSKIKMIAEKANGKPVHLIYTSGFQKDVRITGYGLGWMEIENVSDGKTGTVFFSAISEIGGAEDAD